MTFPDTAIRYAIPDIASESLKHRKVLGFQKAALFGGEHRDFDGGCVVITASRECIANRIDVLLHDLDDALQGHIGFEFHLIEACMHALKCRGIALIDQVFFGSHVVVETGFGEPQFIGNIGKRC